MTDGPATMPPVLPKESGNKVLLERCSEGGHRYARLPDHPMRDGQPRCPHCMAIGLDSERHLSAMLVVPLVPTEAMIEAAKKSTYVYTAEGTIRTLWKAMVQAA